MSLPVALQLYSVRNEMAVDFEGVLKKVKEYGYDGVEFASLHDKKPEYIKKLLKNIGLIPISAHVPLENLQIQPDKTFETYKEIGCEYIAIPYLDEQRRPKMPLFFDTLDEIRKIGEKALQYDITLLYHNHDFEFEKIDDKFGLDIIYDTIPADFLKTQLDTCWIKVAGQDPAEYIRKYKGRCPVVHLKDFYLKPGAQGMKLYELLGSAEKEDKKEDGELFGFRPLGYGMQDMHEILNACNQSGTKWVVVEQDLPKPGMTELESARLSIKYLNNLIW